MKKILVFMDSFNTGGITNVANSIYQNLDRTKFSMDFMRRTAPDQTMDTEVQKNGDRVYFYKIESLNKIPFFNYLISEARCVKQIVRTLKNEKYDVIHIHAHPNVALKAAKKLNIPTRIMHVHEAVTDFNGNEKKSKITNIIWKRRQRMYNTLATVKAGDSMRACSAKFGSIKDCTVIYPSFDMEKFSAQNYSKDLTQKKYNIDDASFNMVHVGRLSYIKNQPFMLDILKEINKGKKADLYIVGEGRIKDELLQYAKKLGVLGNVHFLPKTTPPDIYTKMDCSLLPSFSEAFGMVAVESQLMDVACFASTNVPEDVDIGMCTFLDLEKGAKYWADCILNYDYENMHIDENEKNKFDIKTIIKDVEGLYAGL